MTDLLPPRHSDAERLQSAWAGSYARADEYGVLIAYYVKAGAEYPRRFTLEYLEAVRRVSEYEERMTAAGIPFNRN